MVSPLLIWFGSSRRNNADGFAPHGVGDRKQSAVHHANDNKAILAIVLAVVELFNGDGVLEDIARRRETDAVPGIVVGGFPFVPFEAAVI